MKEKLPLKPLSKGMGIYQVFETPEKCSIEKPFGVINLQTGKSGGRCYVTHEEAAARARRMYATLGARAKVHSEIVVVPVKTFSEPDGWIDGNKKWIKMYPYSTWTHPIFTDTTIDEEIGLTLVKNFHDGVHGDKDLVITYDHGQDPAKGGKAAGWVRDMEARTDGVYELVEFTSIAKQEVLDGEWRYFSGEHYDSWTHPQRNETYTYVPNGGALTNKPWVRDGILPLNFSEVFVEREANPSGKAESDTMDTDVTNESADIEHSEPGTGSPPVPKVEEINNDNAADSGSRRDTPPVEDTMDDRLRELLGLDPDADIYKAVEGMKAEVAPLRDVAKAHSDAKAFSEIYPEQARQLQELQKRDTEHKAKSFSESFARVNDKDGRPSNKGYPQIVQDKLEEVYKRFSEGSANVTDLSDVMELIGRTGLVDFTESGSANAGNFDVSMLDDPAKAFSEKVVELQNADNLEYGKAVQLAAEKHPELYEGYRKQVTARR